MTRLGVSASSEWWLSRSVVSICIRRPEAERSDGSNLGRFRFDTCRDFRVLDVEGRVDVYSVTKEGEQVAVHGTSACCGSRP